MRLSSEMKALKKMLIFISRCLKIIIGKVLEDRRTRRLHDAPPDLDRPVPFDLNAYRRKTFDSERIK